MGPTTKIALPSLSTTAAGRRGRTYLAKLCSRVQLARDRRAAAAATTPQPPVAPKHQFLFGNPLAGPQTLPLPLKSLSPCLSPSPLAPFPPYVSPRQVARLPTSAHTTPPASHSLSRHPPARHVCRFPPPLITRHTPSPPRRRTHVPRLHVDVRHPRVAASRSAVAPGLAAVSRQARPRRDATLRVRVEAAGREARRMAAPLNAKKGEGVAVSGRRRLEEVVGG